MNTKTIFRGSLIAALISGASVAGAADVQWLNAASHDLSAASQLLDSASAPLAATANRNRELVEFQWALAADAEIASSDPGSHNESRQYWLDVSAADLNRGVAVYTTSRNALLRISPLQANADTTLELSALQLQQNGRLLSNDSSVNSFVTSQQLNAAGAPFAEGTIAFRLNRTVAPGALNLAIANGAQPDARYVIHVFEPDSAVAANLHLAKGNVLSGAAIDIALNVSRAQGSVRGFLISPDGKTSLPLQFRTQGDAYVASVNAPAAQGTGLWEVQTFFDGASEGQRVLRDVKTAVNITAPTARLSQQASLRDDGGRSDALALDVGVEVAADGRYQLSGVLYGTAKDGSQQPIAMAQSAQWLNAGNHSLPLTFTIRNGEFSRTTAGAPYEIRDLRLLDQSRMGVLHRQERALSIQ
ncbi:MAG: hypothetical protein Tsb002_34700 [Wenzhouxiangellaceae bacterium]